MKDDEIVAIREHLEKSISDGNTNIVIDQLDLLVKVRATTELLKKTRIGVVVTNLRKHENATEKIREKSKALIAKWKDDVAHERKESNDSVVEGHERTVANDGIELKSKGDRLRDKCTEMLYAALAVESDLDGVIIIKKASSIEQKVFEMNNGTSNSYKSKIRSLQFNLKDKNNPKLRNRVLIGDISVDKFCKMSPEEMASEERKQEIEEAQKQNMMDAQTAADQSAETDQFKCGKCKKRKCKYFQMQTRSADEPMTTFVTCINCGHRWRFC